MNSELPKSPTPPDGARYLRVGETAVHGDYLWDKAAGTWRLVRAGEDVVITAKEFGWYCRRVIG